MNDLRRAALAEAFMNLSRAAEHLAAELLAGDRDDDEKAVQTADKPPRARKGSKLLDHGPDSTPARPRAESKPTPLPNAAGDDARSPTARKFLVTLKQLGKPVSRFQLAFFAKVSPNSSSVDNALAELRRDDLIAGDKNGLMLTSLGSDVIGDVGQLPARHELFEMLCSRLEPTPEAFLRVLKKEHGALSRDELAEKAERSTTSSSVDNAISTLRKLDFIEGSGGAIRLSAELRAALAPTVGVFDASSGKSVRVDARGGHVR